MANFSVFHPLYWCGLGILPASCHPGGDVGEDTDTIAVLQLYSFYVFFAFWQRRTYGYNIVAMFIWGREQKDENPEIKHLKILGQVSPYPPPLSISLTVNAIFFNGSRQL